MVNFEKKILGNGLRVLVHEDNSTHLCAVNVVYDVGARDESPERTGFAHLFEHLMFGGSENVDSFDDEIQVAGGDSNAFTNNDLTNFYDILPIENIETALWLESDRMRKPKLNQESLDVQRKVVVEEFKESCLSQPYGDVWHRMSELAYTVHPYQWPTIGKDIRHILEAKLEDVHSFSKKYYKPSNALLVIAGPIKPTKAFDLAEKWFGDITSDPRLDRSLPQEPRQVTFKSFLKRDAVPVNALYLGFHMPGRMDPDYYIYDLLSDILANGQSSRFYQKLVVEKELFSSIDTFVTGNFDPGLLVIAGKLAGTVSKDQALQAIWEELRLVRDIPVSDIELDKYKNKAESNIIFSEQSILNKAITLAQYELLGDAKIINEEVNEYRKVTVEQIQAVAQDCFVIENCSEVFYAKTEEESEMTHS